MPCFACNDFKDDNLVLNENYYSFCESCRTKHFEKFKEYCVTNSKEKLMHNWSEDDDIFESLSNDRNHSQTKASVENIHFLYTRKNDFETSSNGNCDIINNSALVVNNQYLNRRASLLRKPESIPKYSSKLKWPTENSEIVRKDTRQKLVDQETDEIRKKIREEIESIFKEKASNLIKSEKCIQVNHNSRGVSTDSSPRLGQEEFSSEPSKNVIEEPQEIELNYIKNRPKEYLIMNVDVKNEKILEFPHLKPKLYSEIDMKFQEVMGTVLECAPNSDVTTEDQMFYKYLSEKFPRLHPAKLEEIISSITQEEKLLDEACHPSGSVQIPEKLQESKFILNAYRAFYNPPRHNQSETQPRPQFQKLGNFEVSYNDHQVVDAASLNIPRNPVTCPISTCERKIFLSDFSRHIADDHGKVPIGRIFPKECKNFFLDPKLINFGVSRCQLLLLVRDKIRNLGHEKFKDFIPVLMMTTRVNLFELWSDKKELGYNDVHNKHKLSFIMVWLTGIMPPQLPIFFTLTVWSRSGYIPICHIVHSGQLYSLRNLQSLENVFKSGQMLLLSENQIDLLTNNGRNMLELQIEVR